MITNTYNKTVEHSTTDNIAVIQGDLSKKTHHSYARTAVNRNHAPVTSFAKTMKDENPITEEVLSDGLGSLFAAATGFGGFELIMDIGFDAIDAYDDFIQDRAGHNRAMPTPQIDPRLWIQPQPGFAMAA